MGINVEDQCLAIKDGAQCLSVIARAIMEHDVRGIVLAHSGTFSALQLLGQRKDSQHREMAADSKDESKDVTLKVSEAHITNDSEDGQEEDSGLQGDNTELNFFEPSERKLVESIDFEKNDLLPEQTAKSEDAQWELSWEELTEMERENLSRVQVRILHLPRRRSEGVDVKDQLVELHMIARVSLFF